MARQKLRGGLTVKTFTLDHQQMTEFEKLCQEERKNMSEYIRDLINGELEKKAVGPENPIKLIYNQANKHQVDRFTEFPLDRFFTTQDAHEKITDYMEKYKVPLPNAYTYHNKMQQIISLKMRQK